MDFIFIKGLYPELRNSCNKEIYKIVKKDNDKFKTYNEFNKKYKDFDIKIYYNFNEDLESFNKYELLKHWIDHGVNEGRIHNKESFFIHYPNLNLEIYKLCNLDLKNMDEIELMLHWHNLGSKEERVFNIEIYKERNRNINFDLIRLLKFQNKEVEDIEIIKYIEKSSENLNFNNIKFWDEKWNKVEYNNKNNLVKYLYFEKKIYLKNNDSISLINIEDINTNQIEELHKNNILEEYKENNDIDQFLLDLYQNTYIIKYYENIKNEKDIISLDFNLINKIYNETYNEKIDLLNDIDHGIIYSVNQIKKINYNSKIKILKFNGNLYVNDLEEKNLIKINNYINNYVNNKSFDDLINDIKLLKNQINKNIINEINIVYICYISQNNCNIIKKLIEKNKTNEFIVFIFNKDLQNIDNELKLLENNFDNYLVFKSNNYNNEIIPLLQVTNIIRNELSKIDYMITLNDYNLKHDKESKKIIDESIDFLLSESIDYYVNKLDYNNSNLVSNEKCLKEIKGNNQIILLSKYENIYDKTKKYILGNNFFCETKIFDSILNFIENNNYRGYFYNNLFDKNIVLYLNSPANFISILFGTISLDSNENNNLKKNQIKLNIYSHKIFEKVNNLVNSYSIIYEINSKEYINNKLWAHLHCYNIDKFEEIYGKYIENIINYYSIILTYSIGTKLPDLKLIILKIKNRGMDIGAKICCLNYLYNNKINYNNILFLHSKTNLDRRNKYFHPFIKNKSQINYISSICQNYELIIHDLIEDGDWNAKEGYTINKYYYDFYNKLMGFKHLTDLFNEGNCLIASRKLVQKIFPEDKLEYFYKKLNDKKSFDYNWVRFQYNLGDRSYKEVYDIYKKNNLIPNHLNLEGKIINDNYYSIVHYDKNLCNTNKNLLNNNFNKNKFLKDGSIEHLWERLWINVCLNINGKYKIIKYEDILGHINLKYQFNTNLYKLLNCKSNEPNTVEHINKIKKSLIENNNIIYSLQQILEKLPIDFDIEKYSKENNLCKQNKYEILNNFIEDKNNKNNKNNKNSKKKWISLQKEFNSIKTFVFIFPQFHKIKENDEFWGEGFTEWWNVKKTYQIHNKHLPMYPHEDIGYYNILDYKTRKRWNNYAKEYNLFGYIFYHYYFSEGIVMNDPLDKILEDNQPDKPWFLNWVNENWTKRWDGGNNEILLKIEINLEKCRDHFNYLLKYFRHKNYYKIGNKPCLAVYRPEEIQQEYIDLLNKLAIENGFDGILFMKTLNNNIDNQVIFNKNKYWDYEFEYPPNYSGTLVNARINNDIFDYQINKEKSYNYDINKHYKALIKTKQKTKKLIRGIMPSWDNFPRHTSLKSDCHIQINSNSLLFYFTLIRQFYNIKKEKGEYFFINSLNEWGEQCVLEPSIQNEYSYLEAFKLAKKTDLDQVDINLVDKFINF